MNIPLQTRVKNKDGEMGVTCPDFMSSCTKDEVPVVYDGTTASLGTLESDLEIIGPENAIADFIKCGAGKGNDCCIFLTAGPEGASCERYSSLRHTLIFKEMNSKRNPSEPYPNCMIFG